MVTINYNNHDIEQETLQSTKKSLRPAGKAGKAVGKKLASTVGKKLLAVLAPFLPAILIILVILLLLWFIVGTVLSSTPQGELFIGPERTQQDEKLVEFYNEIADKNNKRDKWLVPGEKDGSWYEEINTDIVIEKQFPKLQDEVLTNEDIEKIGTHQAINPSVKHYYAVQRLAQQNPDMPWPLEDYYHRDEEFLETFGQVHSGSVWHMLTFNEEHTTDEFKEFNGAEYRPYLYYKDSYIETVTTTWDDEGNSTTTRTVEPLYLIVEANALQDHQVFHYEWKTETYTGENSETTVTWEELVGQTSIRVPNPWQRLDDWVQEKYEILEDKKDEIEIARFSVWEAGIGYTKAIERLEWLFSNQVDKRYLSESFVPDNIMSAFHAAEDLFGIPAWFLAALAMIESSLNPEAENNKSGAYGLFQLTEGTRKMAVDKLIAEYSDKLPPQLVELYNNTPIKDDDFYKQALKDPYINTLAGSLVFIGKCTQNNIKISDIDWNGDWLNQVLPALTDYGGHVSVPKNLWSKYGIKNEKEAKERKNLEKWCYDDYASKVSDYAERFKIQKVMPIAGLKLSSQDKGGHITSFYGLREDPFTGQTKGHSGIDIGAPLGTPILSIGPGTVISASYKNEVAGWEVIVDHGTYKTRYLHCRANSPTVKVGDWVAAGTKIAEVGSTGRSTGPHLHLEVYVMDSTGNFHITDPYIFLSK